MRVAGTRRGQPLVILGLVVGGWVLLRVAMWDNPFALPPAASAAPSSLVAERDLADPVAQRTSGPTDSLGRSAAPLPVAPAFAPPLPLPASTVPGTAFLPGSVPAPPPALPGILEVQGVRGTAPVPAPAPAAFPADRPVAHAVGHSLLLMAGLSRMELPEALLAYMSKGQGSAAGGSATAPAPATPAARERRSAASRWSGDGWLMLRQDNASPLLSGRPSYGRSQAGAVLRYRLAPSWPLAPQAQARASAALALEREKELAVGLSLRPVPRLPVRVAAEVRAGETDAGTQLRPAAFAVTELPPQPLPLGLKAEAYAQAGYVGGAFATAFVDGQARVDGRALSIGPADLRAGAGLWGGAQEGAARLDVGPGASLAFRVGQGQGRLAADYRFRIAGRAEPASGPALTLSAGF